MVRLRPACTLSIAFGLRCCLPPTTTVESSKLPREHHLGFRGIIQDYHVATRIKHASSLTGHLRCTGNQQIVWDYAAGFGRCYCNPCSEFSVLD